MAHPGLFMWLLQENIKKMDSCRNHLGNFPSVNRCSKYFKIENYEKGYC